MSHHSSEPCPFFHLIAFLQAVLLTWNAIPQLFLIKSIFSCVLPAVFWHTLTGLLPFELLKHYVSSTHFSI